MPPTEPLCVDEALDKIERLLRKAERDARLLDGRDYKHRPFAEAYRLLDLLRAAQGEEADAAD